MRQTLLRCYPGLWILIEHFRDQMLCIIAYVTPMLRIEFQFLFQYIAKYLRAVVTLERWIAAQKYV